MSPGDRVWLHNGQAGQDCATLVARPHWHEQMTTQDTVEVWYVTYDREPQLEQLRGIDTSRIKKCPDAVGK